MKLTVNFGELRHAAKIMGAEEADFELGFAFKDIDPIDAALRDGQELGKDIDLKDIENTNGVLSYRGRQVMLYIPDQGSNLLEVLQDGEAGRRIHVAECSSLEHMRATGRFPRYQITTDTSGYLPVYGINENKEALDNQKAKLYVCKNCLQTLNYKGYAIKTQAEKRPVFKHFSLAIFFKTYSSHFKSLPEPKKSENSPTYTSDWKEISAKLKQQANYICEQCSVDLDEEKRLMHVHHVDGVKSNNHGSSLRVLCADCHKKQPHHNHLFIKAADVLTINRLRREQHKFDNTTYSQLLECADTALEGLILKCQYARAPLGELGIAVQYERNSISFDLCWPRKKVAVLIDMRNEAIVKNHGWTVFSATQALENFYKFQRHIR
ncbi:MAG: HNH endonuclease [Colwellia sp.]|nr:HNH endonuclease [Colwellia sp.]